ncbi:recombinase family protein [Arthrobacter ruber]|uniref:recombinase family protein n=1 Tax=Arthrobacter ruber TaxID=1258893 RepID=UPI0023E80A13|nr:recombinase family protein [Arthrobacter ruber]
MGSIGYAKVSSLDHNADLQHAALRAAGCDRIFTDHGVSGTRASLPRRSSTICEAVMRLWCGMWAGWCAPFVACWL